MPEASQPGPDGLIFLDDATGPQTHVLIVGVGHYPYFQEGGPEAYESAPLKQLLSSTASARLLTQWFANKYNYPPAPLGSLAWLSSEVSPKPLETRSGLWSPVVPTYDVFASAAQAWKARGDSREDNRMIFLFCGHGYGFGPISSLLMADFDFRDPACWDRALDLGKFHSGMETCAAAEQIFFVDSCRRPHGDMLPPGAAIGRSPVHITAKPRENFSSGRNAPLVFSAAADMPARGRKDGASVFADAFIKSVDGMAARDDEGDWRVGYYALLDALSHISWRTTEDSFLIPQQPQGTGAQRFDFHYLDHLPVSPIYLHRDGGPCGPGDLHYQVGSDTIVRACSADEIELEISLPYGGYEFTLRGGSGLIAQARQQASPIYKKARLT